jgi:DDE_Tnp_1-associated/Transposase DDE domain
MTTKNNPNILGKQKNLFELLREIKDTRRKQGQRYNLQALLLIIIMAIMQGARSERAVSRFAKNNQKSLIKELQIDRKQAPSRRVLAKLVQNLDFKILEKIFYQWAKSFVKIERGDWIGLDGKAIRGTHKKDGDKLTAFISLVTVFASKQRQVISVGKLNTHKENEIPTVQELLKSLDLEGVIFTMDAMHCQTKTLKAIVKSKNHYVIGVKGNQKKLLNQLKKTAKASR